MNNLQEKADLLFAEHPVVALYIHMMTVWHRRSGRVDMPGYMSMLVNKTHLKNIDMAYEDEILAMKDALSELGYTHEIGLAICRISNTYGPGCARYTNKLVGMQLFDERSNILKPLRTVVEDGRPMSAAITDAYGRLGKKALAIMLLQGI